MAFLGEDLLRMLPEEMQCESQQIEPDTPEQASEDESKPKRMKKPKRPDPKDDDTVLMSYECPKETALKIIGLIGASNMTFIQPTNLTIRLSPTNYMIISSVGSNNKYACNEDVVDCGLKVKYTSKVPCNAFVAQVKENLEDKTDSEMVVVKIAGTKQCGEAIETNTDYQGGCCWLYLAVDDSDLILPLNKQKESKGPLSTLLSVDDIDIIVPLMAAVADVGLNEAGKVARRDDIPDHYEVVVAGQPTSASFLVKRSEVGDLYGDCAIKMSDKEVVIFTKGALAGMFNVITGGRKKKFRVVKKPDSSAESDSCDVSEAPKKAKKKVAPAVVPVEGGECIEEEDADFVDVPETPVTVEEHPSEVRPVQVAPKPKKRKAPSANTQSSSVQSSSTKKFKNLGHYSST